MRAHEIIFTRCSIHSALRLFFSATSKEQKEKKRRKNSIYPYRGCIVYMDCLHICSFPPCFKFFSSPKTTLPALPYIFIRCRWRVKVLLRMSKFSESACAVGAHGKIQYGGVLVVLSECILWKMFKKLKQKLAEESDGEQSPRRQAPGETQVW